LLCKADERPDLIRIATCFHPKDVGFLIVYLEAHGVHVEKTNDYFIHAAPVYTLATGGIELWIRGSDASLAADLMEQWQAEQQNETGCRTTGWMIAMILSFWAFIVFGLSYGWPPPFRSGTFVVAPSLVRQLGDVEVS